MPEAGPAAVVLVQHPREEQVPVDGNVGDAGPDEAEDPPRSSDADVLGKEDGREDVPTDGADEEDQEGSHPAVGLLDGRPYEPQGQHIEQVVDYSGVQDHGGEEAVPLPPVDDEGGLLGPHPY